MSNCVTSDNINSQGRPNACFMNAVWQVRHKPDTMCSSSKQASQIVNKRFHFFGEYVYILCKTCSIAIIIPLFYLCWDSAQASHVVSSKRFATYLWIKALAHRCCCLSMTPKDNKTSLSLVGYSFTFWFVFSLPLFISGDKCQLWTGDLWDRKDKAQFTNHFLSKQTGATTEPACCNWISCCYLLSHKKMSTSRILAVQKVLIHYDFECGDDNIVGVLSLDSEWNILKWFLSCKNKDFPDPLNGEFIRDNMPR